MKKIIAIALCLMMTLTACAAFAETEITTVGTAVITASPDIVTVTGSVAVIDASLQAVQDKMNATIADVTDKLIALGIAEDDIVTDYYNTYPLYDYEQTPAAVTGYQGSHSLAITCRDITMLDSVLKLLTECGMTDTGSIRYDVAARAELYRQALVMASLAAKEKAAQMAEGMGLTLGELDTLVENQSYTVDYVTNATGDFGRAESKALAGGSSAGVRSGKIEIEASVTATFEAR